MGLDKDKGSISRTLATEGTCGNRRLNEEVSRYFNQQEMVKYDVAGGSAVLGYEAGSCIVECHERKELHGIISSLDFLMGMAQSVMINCDDVIRLSAQMLEDPAQNAKGLLKEIHRESNLYQQVVMQLFTCLKQEKQMLCSIIEIKGYQLQYQDSLIKIMLKNESMMGNLVLFKQSFETLITRIMSHLEKVAVKRLLEVTEGSKLHIEEKTRFQQTHKELVFYKETSSETLDCLQKAKTKHTRTADDPESHLSEATRLTLPKTGDLLLQRKHMGLYFSDQALVDPYYICRVCKNYVAKPQDLLALEGLENVFGVYPSKIMLWCTDEGIDQRVREDCNRKPEMILWKKNFYEDVALNCKTCSERHLIGWRVFPLVNDARDVTAAVTFILVSEIQRSWTDDVSESHLSEATRLTLPNTGDLLLQRKHMGLYFANQALVDPYYICRVCKNYVAKPQDLLALEGLENVFGVYPSNIMLWCTDEGIDQRVREDCNRKPEMILWKKNFYEDVALNCKTCSEGHLIGWRVFPLVNDARDVTAAVTFILVSEIQRSWPSWAAY